MSWNPPPEVSGGWADDPGQPPPGQQPLAPGYIPPPPPGQPYGQPGAAGRGYGPPPGPGVPGPEGYGMPGPGGYPPPRRRRRIFGLLGIGGAVSLVVIIVGSVLAHEHGNHRWKLTAPSAAAGLPRDKNPLDTVGLSIGIASGRSAITKVSGNGAIKSSVSAAYQRGPGPLVWFVGFNGSFSQQLVLDRYQGARVVSVNAGPHGGAAECARSALATLCQWSTATTVGDLIIRTSASGGSVSISSADSLMIKMRSSVEQPG